MKLSQGEKLILLALAATEDGEEPIDLAFIRSAILSGNTWALTWRFSGVPIKDVDPSIAAETGEILSMWSYIEHSVNALPQAERDELEKAAYPYSLQFNGFDGNNDDHFGVAEFMIRDLGRFDDFQNRELNSHTQTSLPHYRAMLPKYREALQDLRMGTRSLPAGEILRIVKPATE